MKDQADALRERINNMEPIEGSVVKKSLTQVYSIVSGKGGVGKSNVAVNFALQLQKMRKKVLIIDLDIGMANIDILLGTSSSYSIVDMLEKDMSIWSIIERVESGLSYIAGGSGLNHLFKMNDQKADSFSRELLSLEGHFDYIFLDMGAGVTSDSFHFLLSAHETLLVTTPEPTSITDAYAMIKFLTLNDRTIPISVIVNRASSKKDGENASRNLQQVTEKFLKREIHYLAYIPNDQIVWKAVRAQTPFLLYAPNSKPSYAIETAVHTFLGETGRSKETFDHFINKLKGFLKGGKKP
ncbi:MinD/ParA family protein [Alkalicoccus daliensis]|uniref:Flagellar biosynthesis protein FlhG n=1 Tax=Alkalicoccus daliensis TaxID=745820 RepID=A0A1H0A5Y1_9BACI|nr:MinD/ParA family protein [Alkalicoccus daliensis]SDN28651.1 flagellar biosynthesis protein FlhG [Alkalicoccus daliensis]